MIRWRLDLIRAGGPQNIVHVSLPIPPESAGRWAKRGELRLTPAEYDDLLMRLCGAAAPILPCARCGQPVPAGQATHGDCAPIRCNFCTQCGKRLGTDERVYGVRVCLVSCAPLADGLVAS